MAVARLLSSPKKAAGGGAAVPTDGWADGGRLATVCRWTARANVSAAGVGAVAVVGVARMVALAAASVALVAGAWEVLADRHLARAADTGAGPSAAAGLAEADRGARLRPDSIRTWYVAARVAARGDVLTDVDAALARTCSGLRRSPRDPALRLEYADLAVERGLLGPARRCPIAREATAKFLRGRAQPPRLPRSPRPRPPARRRRRRHGRSSSAPGGVGARRPAGRRGPGHGGQVTRSRPWPRRYVPPEPVEGRPGAGQAAGEHDVGNPPSGSGVYGSMDGSTTNGNGPPGGLVAASAAVRLAPPDPTPTPTMDGRASPSWRPPRTCGEPRAGDRRRPMVRPHSTEPSADQPDPAPGEAIVGAPGAGGPPSDGRSSGSTGSLTVDGPGDDRPIEPAAQPAACCALRPDRARRAGAQRRRRLRGVLPGRLCRRRPRLHARRRRPRPRGDG